MPDTSAGGSSLAVALAALAEVAAAAGVDRDVDTFAGDPVEYARSPDLVRPGDDVVVLGVPFDSLRHAPLLRMLRYPTRMMLHLPGLVS
jgi:hypothetical protein